MGRWKEDSLRNVGRKDARTDGGTLRWFYTLSNAIHCIGQTIIPLSIQPTVGQLNMQWQYIAALTIMSQQTQRPYLTHNID